MVSLDMIKNFDPRSMSVMKDARNKMVLGRPEGSDC